MIKRLIIKDIKYKLIKFEIFITALVGLIIQHFFKFVYTFLKKCDKIFYIQIEGRIKNEI